MKLHDLNILVTGGAGFIGSHLVEALAKKNHVMVYDNFSSSVVFLKDLSSLHNVRVMKGNILDQRMLTRAMSDIDVVFHLAVACVRLSLTQSRFVHEVNTTGTLSTLLSAVNSGVKKFIYISSSEVYGGTNGAKISEHHSLIPTTVYGLSKYEGELLSELFCARFHLPSVIIRPFNTYGPRSHFEGVYGEVIPRFVIRALAGKSPIIFGDGAQTRDFTYITDTITGIMKASESDKAVGQTVNIAYGKEVAIRTIARTVSKLADIPYAPTMLPARPHDVRRLAADIRRARKLFGYSPKVSLDVGLARYIDWVKKTVSNPQKLLTSIPQTNW